MQKNKIYISLMMTIFCHQGYAYDYNQSINIQDVQNINNDLFIQKEGVVQPIPEAIVTEDEYHDEEMIISIKKETPVVKPKPIKKYSTYLSKSDKQLVIDEVLKRKYITQEEVNNSLILITGVKKLQHDYNLTEDGIISKILSYNISLPIADKEVSQNKYIQEMPEIIKKIDPSQSNQYIIVNIPSYQLSVFDAITHEEILRSKVIIGKQDRKTPLITTNITHVKYNPDWTPPPSIVRKDILPSLDSDGKYIRSHNLIAYSPDGEIYDTDELTSEDVSEYGIKFRQPASANNALGVLKFETDNNLNIYLHDTNQKYLFKEAIRSFSSGCIRVEKFKELASIVVDKPIEHIDNRISTKKTIFEKTKKIPVFITYLPAFKYQDKWSYYPDIYRMMK